MLKNVLYRSQTAFFAIALLALAAGAFTSCKKDKEPEHYSVTIEYNAGIGNFDNFYPVEKLDKYLGDPLIDTIYANNIATLSSAGINFDRYTSVIIKPAVNAAKGAGKVFWFKGNVIRNATMTTENRAYWEARGAEFTSTL